MECWRTKRFVKIEANCKERLKFKRRYIHINTLYKTFVPAKATDYFSHM